MENDVRVTVCGWVSEQPQVRSGPAGEFLTFRVGSTPRYRNSQGEYADMRTEWFDVKVKSLALVNNVRRSVFKGDPVMVSGRLNTHRWEAKDGTNHWALQIQADAVGHDLRWGDTRFKKVRLAEHRRDMPGQAEPSPSSEPIDQAELSPGSEPEEQPDQIVSESGVAASADAGSAGDLEHGTSEWVGEPPVD